MTGGSPRWRLPIGVTTPTPITTGWTPGGLSQSSTSGRPRPSCTTASTPRRRPRPAWVGSRWSTPRPIRPQAITCIFAKKVAATSKAPRRVGSSTAIPRSGRTRPITSGCSARSAGAARSGRATTGSAKPSSGCSRASRSPGGRIGMARRMVAAGAPTAAVQHQGRWKHDDMVAHYTRGEAAGEALKWLT